MRERANKCNRACAERAVRKDLQEARLIAGLKKKKSKRDGEGRKEERKTETGQRGNAWTRARARMSDARSCKERKKGERGGVM